jgi:hypothetical protein
MPHAASTEASTEQAGQGLIGRFPERRRHQQPGPRQLARQVPEQQQRRLVGPLQVLENDHQSTSRGGIRERLTDPGEHEKPGGRRVVNRLGRYRVGQRGDEPLPWPQRRPAGVVDRVAMDGRYAVLPRHVLDRRDEAGLPDALLAADQHHPPGAAGCGDQVGPQLRQLPVPADDRHLHDQKYCLA